MNYLRYTVYFRGYSILYGHVVISQVGVYVFRLLPGTWSRTFTERACCVFASLFSVEFQVLSDNAGTGIKGVYTTVA